MTIRTHRRTAFFSAPKACRDLRAPFVFLVCCFSIVATLLFASALGQDKPKDGTPKDKDEFAERRTAAESAGGAHRAKLFVELAHAEMEAANQAFTEGNVDRGHKLAQQSGDDAGIAADAARESGKRLKDTEIDLRKLETRTRDIARSLAFEDRGAVEKIVQRLEQLRGTLLDRMFGDKKKGKG